ncbi:TolC family protein [Xanthobacter agilis]|uniref:Protein CyaE n=1 Tax=Xanthobacter agilis TaxID=47492 RepID=A0ABU0L839_XANAG|nr:TolC family protein [Xanthobacter agilis]MDQ0503268.1 outer membrane protein TolC [Xanthobacter agilis]
MADRAASRVGRGLAALVRWGVAGLACAVLSACTLSALDSAPSHPSEPWTPSGDATAAGASPPEAPEAAAQGPSAPSAQAAPVRDFAVPPDPAVATLKPAPAIARDRAYGLPELIDLAQTQNPQTRVAWQQARQAALATGMIEATFLPYISANVIGGYQKISQPLPVSVGSVNQLSTSIDGISPQIALQWLVFDFGERNALAVAARHNADAANVLFNGLHQKIIFDVTRTYFLYGAARSRVGLAEQNLANSRKIEDAADARMQKGLGTTVEVAQARQQVAQARFGLVQAQGGERDAYQALLGALGVSPMTELKVKVANGRRLPESVGAPTEKMISAALTQRPDVLAAFSALKATQSGITAAEAAFMPKVFLGAVAATGNTSLSATGLPTIGQQSSASGVMVGATMPLFDGGLRAAQLKNAESLAAATEATYEKAKDAAAREIVVSANTLRSALASYRAATALADAAALTYDAALDAYRTGVGTITVATAADSGLLTARQAQADAHAASLVAAANLAFVLGAMTSREAPSALMAR